eukprot:CAMPEP_0177648162 /NCGR_PEP_ID=MMETSP0447-20121125/10683_1 /TAXON_ID=0 /ORGANISM="Stygamoeba regulata, Strain BSH-02190019" /LENGTH=341 /DNA_ID=CAMNT_0019150789 /DNA_START=74 /DNA_END=1099 /DNA_ORIENTATION=-
MTDSSTGTSVQWAPVRVPFRRRLQTLAILFWTMTGPLFAFFWGLLICALLAVSPLAWPLLIVYLVYFYFDKSPQTGGRKWMWVRRMPVWRLCRDYFPARLVKTVELDPKQSYLFGYHPHGIISVGAFLNFATEATGFSTLFPGVDLRVLTLKMNFLSPFIREYWLSFGFCDVSRESIRALFKQGSSPMIVVGGAREALDAHPKATQLTLICRKGFVREALLAGASLVPVFAFGENDLYDQLENKRGSILRERQEKLMRWFGFSMPLFQGRGVFNYTFGILPQRRPLTAVVGAPIPLPKLENPSREQILKYHTIYVEALRQLFEDHREKYAQPGTEDFQVVG